MSIHRVQWPALSKPDRQDLQCGFVPPSRWMSRNCGKQTMKPRQFIGITKKMRWSRYVRPRAFGEKLMWTACLDMSQGHRACNAVAQEPRGRRTGDRRGRNTVGEGCCAGSERDPCADPVILPECSGERERHAGGGHGVTRAGPCPRLARLTRRATCLLQAWRASR
jgi:hypothetical protein